MHITQTLLCSALTAGLLVASLPAQSQEATAQPVAAGTPAPLPAPAANISAMLGRLEQVAQSMQVDLAKMRVDKWKTDSSSKAQTQADIGSMQRNLTSALPNVMNEVRTNPANITSAFRLYRNVNALYDVLTTTTEMAGAFGSKDEYRALASDTQNLDDARRLLADQLESLASVKESEIAQLRSQVVAAKAATPQSPPKKIIVDDNAPSKKKTTSHKKTTTTSQAKPE